MAQILFPRHSGLKWPQRLSSFIGGISLLAVAIFPSVAAERQESIESQTTACVEDEWVDNIYCYLNTGIDNSANSINAWFYSADVDDSPASTRGRIRLGWEPRSTQLGEFDLRFRIRMKLPAFEDRVELLLSDEEDDLNRQDVKAARREEFGNTSQTVVALQFKAQEKDKMSYRIGFGRGSQLYTRARYSDAIKIDDKVNFFYFTEANYYSSDKLGFEINGELGIELDSRSAIEFNNSFRFRDPSDDWFWRHEIQYLYLTENNTSYLFTAMIDGLSRPTYRKKQMFVSMRYKQQVYREWLFFELEPFILWLREENFRASFGLAIRAEIHFET